MLSRPVPGRPNSGPQWQRRAIVPLLVVALFTAGVAAGAWAGTEVSPERRQELSMYVQQLMDKPGTDGARRPAPAWLLQHALWEQGVKTAGFMWVLGLSLIGAPFILAVVFLRGFGLGFSAGFLIQERMWEGILLTLAGVLPHQLFFVPGILLAGSASLSFSAVAAAIILGRRQLSALRPFLLSAALCALAGALLLAGTFVEAYITPILLQAVGGYVNW